MKIKSVECVQLVLPPPPPPKTPARRPSWADSAEVANPMSKFSEFKRIRSLWLPDKWPNYYVKITAEDGTWGLGPCCYGRATAFLIQDHLAGLLIGQDALAIERVWDLMFRATKPYGTVGLASCAMSGVDLAMWDLAGKLLHKPVYDLLGGKVRDKIFAYATGNDTDWQLELGFKAVKLACPYGPADGLWGLDENEKLIAKTRELVGDSVEIMLDCYMAFDVEYTVRLAERLRPYKLEWMEEYLIPEDLSGHVAVRERIPWQTLATGEHMYTMWPYRFLIENRALDILQPDMLWVGGLTPCRRIAEMADVAGLTTILHGGAGSPYGTHLTIAMPNMPWGEWGVWSAPGVPLEELPRLPGYPLVKNGWVTVDDAPGFGVDVPADALVPFIK